MQVSAQTLQSCPTLCDPLDCSPPVSSVLGILQARTLEVARSPPGDRPNPGIEPASLCLLHQQADSLALVPSGAYFILLDAIKSNCFLHFIFRLFIANI